MLNFFFFSDDTYSLGLSKGNKRISQTTHSQTDKLKSSFNDQKSMNKKIRLCSISKVENECNGICKRSCEEQSEVYTHTHIYIYCNFL